MAQRQSNAAELLNADDAAPQHEAVILPGSNSVRPQSEIDEAKARRLANLRPWQPGQSGNPGGVPRDSLKRAIKIAQDNGPAVMSTLVAIALDPNEDSRARIVAGQTILDRAYGKIKDLPPQERDADLDLSQIPLELIGQIASLAASLAGAPVAGQAQEPASESQADTPSVVSGPT